MESLAHDLSTSGPLELRALCRWETIASSLSEINHDSTAQRKELQLWLRNQVTGPLDNQTIITWLLDIDMYGWIDYRVPPRKIHNGGVVFTLVTSISVTAANESDGFQQAP